MAGHSHHAGASNAVCTHCDARYCLPTNHVMGPNFDELLELHAVHEEPVPPVRRRGRKKHLPPGPQVPRKVREPTGQHVLAVRVQVEGIPFPLVDFFGVEELECTTCKERNYTKTKNKRTMPDKLALPKFCPRCRKHTEHKEAK